MVAELKQRHLRPVSLASPFALRTEAELTASYDRNPDADWLCVGTVPLSNAKMGPPCTSPFSGGGMTTGCASGGGSCVRCQPGTGDHGPVAAAMTTDVTPKIRSVYGTPAALAGDTVAVSA